MFEMEGSRLRVTIGGEIYLCKRLIREYSLVSSTKPTCRGWQWRVQGRGEAGRKDGTVVLFIYFFLLVRVEGMMKGGGWEIEDCRGPRGFLVGKMRKCKLSVSAEYDEWRAGGLDLGGRGTA